MTASEQRTKVKGQRKLSQLDTLDLYADFRHFRKYMYVAIDKMPRWLKCSEGMECIHSIKRCIRCLSPIARSYDKAVKIKYIGLFLQAFIDERYQEKDIDILKWLTEKVIMNCPQKNCYRKSPLSSWAGLKANKSLFFQDDFHGMPIGNLPSQLFANFLLSDMVRFLAKHGFDCVQYVDDVVVVHKDKSDILAFIPILRRWLQETLGITLHPKKCYIQHYSKGVSFVGGIIKPHRIYLSKRSRRRAFGKTHWIVLSGEDLKKAMPSVNSYLGLTRHYSAYKIRKSLAEMLFSQYGNSIYFNENYNTLKITKNGSNCR